MKNAINDPFAEIKFQGVSCTFCWARLLHNHPRSVVHWKISPKWRWYDDLFFFVTDTHTFTHCVTVGDMFFCVCLSLSSSIHSLTHSSIYAHKYTSTHAEDLSKRLGSQGIDALSWCTSTSHCIVSEAIIRGNLNASSIYRRKRYVFKNVWLENETTLHVYLPPTTPLPPDYTVDIILDTRITPWLPTQVTYRRSSPNIEIKLDIKYSHVSDDSQPRCRRWETRPVYVMQSPHPENIWHVLNDASISAFQTLREEGLMPLVRVGEDGSVREYVDDLEDECPWEIDRDDGAAVSQPYRMSECRRTKGVIKQTTCSPQTERWCRPGVVAPYRADPTLGPIILLQNMSEKPYPKWKATFDAISQDIREWESEIGTCFTELFLGRSNVLNFYVGLFSMYPGFNETTRKRHVALEAFLQVMMTAERHQREDDEKNPNYVPWPGYANPRIEKLRRGIGPEEMDELRVLRKMRYDSIRDAWGVDGGQVLELRTRRREESRDMRSLVEETKIRIKVNSSLGLFPPPSSSWWSRNSGGSGSVQKARPVVTFPWRPSYKRCVINEADILEYILSLYNVTVRITTFEEPLLEVMELMNSTDVFLGMHGAGWTNGLFIKEGASALQIHPFGWYNHKIRQPIRGNSYKNIVVARECYYIMWFNEHADNAFFRPYDFEVAPARKGRPLPFNFSVHPQPDWPTPTSGFTDNLWIYQNTLVKMRDIGPKIDELMAVQGILPMTVASSAESDDGFEKTSANVSAKR